MNQPILDGKALCKAIRAANGDHLVVRAGGKALLFCDEPYLKKVLKVPSTLIVITNPDYKWVPVIQETGPRCVDDVYSDGFNYVLKASSLEAFNAAMAQLEDTKPSTVTSQVYSADETFDGLAIVKKAEAANIERFVVKQGENTFLYVKYGYLNRLRRTNLITYFKVREYHTIPVMLQNNRLWYYLDFQSSYACLRLIDISPEALHKKLLEAESPVQKAPIVVEFLPNA